MGLGHEDAGEDRGHGLAETARKSTDAEVAAGLARVFDETDEAGDGECRPRPEPAPLGAEPDQSRIL